MGTTLVENLGLDSGPVRIGHPTLFEGHTTTNMEGNP